MSTAVVSWWSRRISGATPAGTNAASQWIWGRQARQARGWSLRHTAIGYAIHHASSVFWAMGYEYWRARSPRHPLAKASAVSAIAYVVDYHVVPSRLSPGFERRISPAGMWMTYASVALALYGAHRLRRRG